MKVVYEKCSCNLYIGINGMTLTYLLTEKEGRNKGYAKKVIRIAKKLADKKQKELFLWAGPFMDEPLTKDQLFCFYKKMGFVGTPDSMSYTPKKWR